MIVVPVPSRSDPNLLADWMELRAIVADDSSSSRGDLESAVRTNPTLAPGESDAIVASVFGILRDRAVHAGPGYAFSTSGAQLRLKGDAWRNRTGYLICLCLSWFGEKQVRADETKPARLFEALAAEAAGRFVGGTAVRFGSPRKELPTSFRLAVDELCMKYLGGEGNGSNPAEAIHWSKDGGLDVVAWREPGDGKFGKVILFGACASGRNWNAKTGELNIQSWVNKYVRRPPAGAVIKAFFVPHVLPSEPQWSSLSWDAGILFDRCRIARWAPRLASSLHGVGADWARGIIKQELKAL